MTERSTNEKSDLQYFLVNNGEQREELLHSSRARVEALGKEELGHNCPASAQCRARKVVTDVPSWKFCCSEQWKDLLCW